MTGALLRVALLSLIAAGHGYVLTTIVRQQECAAPGPTVAKLTLLCLSLVVVVLLGRAWVDAAAKKAVAG